MSLSTEGYLILPYSIQNQKIYTLLPFPSSILAVPIPTDLNKFISIARVLGRFLSLHAYIDQDFDDLRYISNKGFRELLRHIFSHSFYLSDNTLFVPIPDADFTVLIEDLPYNILSDKYRIASQFNFYRGTVSKDSLPIPMSIDICTAPDSAIFVMQDYEPWIGMNETLYGGYFTNREDAVACYYIPQGHFPSYSVLQNLKKIVITGSKYCSFDENLPWLNPLYDIFRYVYNEVPKCKMLGICLGTQMLAKALGGETGRNPCMQFISHIETCSMTEDGREELPEIGNTYRVTESHGDCITKLPENGRLYARSDSCAVEMWGIPGRVLGSQGHPEMNDLFVREFHGAVLFNNKAISQDTFENIKKSYVAGSMDSEKLINAFNNFLSR